jgi:hypothetical protein
LRNLFYTGRGNPFVEVTGVVDGKELCIRKEIVTEKDFKCFVDKKAVDDFRTLPLNLESYSRPMLAQTEIAALVNTEQKDRWEQLSYILGQEDLSRLRQHLIELRNAKRDKEYKKDEKEFDGILLDLKKFADLKPLSECFERGGIEEIKYALKTLITKEAIDVSPGDYDNAIRIKLNRILGSDLSKRAVDVKIGAVGALNTAMDNITDTFRQLETYVSEITKEKVDFDKIEFLKKGKQLAAIPECPFCKSTSLTEKRVEEINIEISAAAEVTQNREKCGEIIKAININLSPIQLRNKFRGILPSAQDLKIISQKLSDLDLKELAGEIQAYENAIAEYTDKTLTRLSTQIKTHVTTIENFHFHDIKSISPDDTKSTLSSSLSENRKEMASLLSKWPTIKEKIIKLFVTPSSSTQQEEVEKWILIDKVNSFITNRETFLKKKTLITRVEQLREDVETFEKQEVEKLLTEHSEEIKNYYNRLNPEEKIIFKKIEVKTGVRRQARLIAEAYGTEVNPVTIFSEAHTNSLSLSIYFPQRVDRNLTWDVVILDDPVQSMDQGHSFSLIEILADIKAKKQIIVLTHSKTFAEDLRNRFGLNEVLWYEFSDGGENGPNIHLKKGNTLDYLEFAEKNANGNEIERKSAGNALRGSISAVCGEILLKRGRTLAQVRNFDKSGLSKLFDQVERSSISQSDINKLKMLVEQSHSDSHTWSLRDTTPNGIRQGVQNVREVYSKYILRGA